MQQRCFSAQTFPKRLNTRGWCKAELEPAAERIAADTLYVPCWIPVLEKGRRLYPRSKSPGRAAAPNLCLTVFTKSKGLPRGGKLSIFNLVRAAQIPAVACTDRSRRSRAYQEWKRNATESSWLPKLERLKSETHIHIPGIRRKGSAGRLAPGSRPSRLWAGQQVEEQRALVPRS